MNSLVVFGAGGHGKVVADAAEESNCWESISFVDCRYPDLAMVGRWPVTSSNLTQVCGSKQQFIIAVGDNLVRLRLHKEALAQGLSPGIVIHPSASVSKYAEIGGGSVVLAGSVINIGARIGQCAIINSGAIVDHDCWLGDAVHISPGAKLAGEVVVGDLCWLGVGSNVKNGVTLDENIIVGAGAVVLSDLEPNNTYVGVPVRKIPLSNEKDFVHK